jgi:hyperosmotically inducible protein
MIMRGFVIGLLLGLLIGAAGFWWLSQRPTSAQGETSVSDVDQLMQAKLDAFRLQADKVRQELAETGRVVRQEATVFGKQVADAATDAGITAHIKAKLVADPKLSALDISVSTTDGVVTLSGKVDSAQLVSRAMLLALETSGVRQVISTLQIEKPSAGK